MARNRIDLRSLNDNGKRFVYRLSTLIRTAHIHAMENQAMDYSLQVAAASATRLVNDLGTVLLMGEEDTVHLNDFRVKVSRSMIQTIKHFNAFMHERGVGGFEVTAPTQRHDWQAVVNVMLSALPVPDEADASPSLNMQLHEVGVDSVRFAPPLKLRKGALGSVHGGEGRSVQIETARSMQLYVRALRAMDALNRAEGKGKATLGLSRIVQYLVEHAVEEPRHHLAFLTMKEEDVPYSVQHPVNRTILAVALGTRIGLARGPLLDLGLCSMVADLGMLFVDALTLEKDGPLDQAERAAVERHPLDSARISLGAGRLDISTRRRIITGFEHHLGFDHGGYPAVLRWGNLHLFSRILAVCEVYDALTTTTPWRMAMLPDEALNEMVEMAGHALDPALVGAFVNMIGRYPMGSVVALNTGEIGVVYLNHPDPRDHLRPVVRLVLDPRGEPVTGSVILDLRERDASGGYTRSPVKLIKPEELGIDVKRAMFA